MKEGQTQTFVSAWPGPNDRRTPKWLAAFSSFYSGALAAVTITVLLRISQLLRAMPMAIYIVIVGASITSWCCSLLTGGELSTVNMLVRYYYDVWMNRNLLFTYLSGPGIALGCSLVVLAIWHIGLAYTTVFVVCGNCIASLLIDWLGIGWAHPKRLRPAHVQASALLILGAAFCQFDLFPLDDSALEQNTLMLNGALAVLAGALFSFSCGALAELAALVGSRSRAMTISFVRAHVALPAVTLLLLPREVRSPVLTLGDSWELWLLTPLAAIGLAVTFLAAQVASSEGATSFNIEFWASFTLVAAVATALGVTSMPPRYLDLSHLVGFAFVGAAVLLTRRVSHRAVRLQLEAIPSRRHTDDQCQLCLKNDAEISRLQRELQEPTVHLYNDPAVVIAGAGGAVDEPAAPLEPKSGAVRGL